MARMHLHVSVDDLTQSIQFYNAVFGTEPSVLKEDYAKWLLDDPAVNFAISARGQAAGLDHVGIQTDSAEALSALKTRMEDAQLSIVSQEGTTCCYAESDKHWVQDPSGIAWESYHTLASAPTFNGKTEADTTNADSACCAPTLKSLSFITKPNAKQGGC